MWIFLLACASSEGPEPPTHIERIWIIPGEPRAGEELHVEVLTDREGDSAEGLSFQWLVDGNLAGEGQELSGEGLVGGQDVLVLAENSAGQGWRAAPVRVLNSAPGLQSVAVTPESAVINTSDLRCEVDASDRDGDEIQYELRWSFDGQIYTGLTRSEVLEGDTLPAEVLDDAGEWTCEVVAYDQEERSHPMQASATLSWPGNFWETSQATRQIGSEWTERAASVGESLDMGDMDGDGIADLIIGAPEKGRRIDYGRVGVFFSPLPEDRLYLIQEANFQLWSDEDSRSIADPVVFVGDVDGDGLGDVMTGTQDRGGMVFLLRGDRALSGGEVELSALEDAVSGYFIGGSIAGVGDRDGDGRGEVMVSGSWFKEVWWIWGASLASAGQYVLDDETNCRLALSESEQGTPSVAGLGDVDGDGLHDAAVGDHGAGVGEVLIFTGVAAGCLGFSREDAALTLSGELYGSHFGSSIAGVGDIDSDGLEDLWIGAPGYLEDGGGGTGRAYLFASSEGGGSAISAADARWIVEGSAPGDNLGAVVKRAGDMDQDGAPDLWVGAPGTDREDRENAGVAYLFSGLESGAIKLEGLDERALALVMGERVYEEVGASLAGGEDADGDGRPDLLIGTPTVYGGIGRALFFSGAELMP